MGESDRTPLTADDLQSALDAQSARHVVLFAIIAAAALAVATLTF